MSNVLKKIKGRSNGFKALAAHVYAGGHTIGVLQAGFDVLAHLEEWQFGVETVRKNLGIEVRVGPDNWNVREFRGQVDWMFVNPPCASWSEAGRKVGRGSGEERAADKAARNAERYKHDDRTKCTELCFEQIDEVRPTVFTWESVAAATMNGADFVRDRIEYVHSRGYDVHGLLFNGCDLGLPQTRKRFFFVATKVRMDPFAPDGERTLPRDVLAALKGSKRPVLCHKPKANSARTLKFAKPGDHLNKVYMDMHHGKPPTNARGHRKGCPSFLDLRISFDKLCPTVTGGVHLYHPTQARSLSVDEQKLLCGYPLEYEFVGAGGAEQSSIWDQYAQIAKAVLPPAGNWLARNVLAGLRRGEKVGRKRTATLHNFICDGRKFATSWDDMPGGATAVHVIDHEEKAA